MVEEHIYVEGDEDAGIYVSFATDEAGAVVAVGVIDDVNGELVELDPATALRAAEAIVSRLKVVVEASTATHH